MKASMSSSGTLNLAVLVHSSMHSSAYTMKSSIVGGVVLVLAVSALLLSLPAQATNSASKLHSSESRSRYEADSKLTRSTDLTQRDDDFEPIYANIYLRTTTTNDSFAEDVCSFYDNVTDVAIRVWLDDSIRLDRWFVLPGCFFNWSSMRSFIAYNVIVPSYVNETDPFLRLASTSNFTTLSLTRSKLVNATKNETGDGFPYIPKWTSLFASIPLVSKLTLDEVNLHGPLPSTMPTTLSQLNLPSNSLNGTIPATLKISKDDEVSIVNLANNSLTGTVPSNMINGFLSSFSLDVSSNKLTALPTTFDIQSTYWTLNARNNSIAGSLRPALFAGASNTTFEMRLDLSLNKLSGNLPSDLFAGLVTNLTHLSTLHLNCSANKFAGTLPNFWSPFVPGTYLSYLFLDFSRNNLGGLVGDILLPSNVTDGYKQIYVLEWRLAHNSISGTIAPGLGVGLPILYKFDADLSYNSITGSVPVQISHGHEFGGFDTFSISLAGNQLSGTIPDDWLTSIGTPPSVFVDVSANALEGNVPSDVLCPMVELDTPRVHSLYLNLSHNAFTGPLPRCIRGRTESVTFSVSNNRFSGDLNSSALFTPSSNDIAAASFFTFEAANNQLTGTLSVPSGVDTWSTPAVINVASNQLSSLEVDGQANYIYALDVSGNTGLSGTVPDILFTRDSQLRALAASHTSLNGTFPLDVQVLVIQALDLSHTSIDFCSGARVAWTSSVPSVYFTYCNLEDTDAYGCTSDYPAICSTTAPAVPTSPIASPPSTPSSPPASGPSPKSPSKAPTSGSPSISRLASTASFISLILALALFM